MHMTNGLLSENLISTKVSKEPQAKDNKNWLCCNAKLNIPYLHLKTYTIETFDLSVSSSINASNQKKQQ